MYFYKTTLEVVNPKNNLTSCRHQQVTKNLADPFQVNTDWHQGKYQWNDDGKAGTNSLYNAYIFLIIQAQRSERTLESMQ